MFKEGDWIRIKNNAPEYYKRDSYKIKYLYNDFEIATLDKEYWDGGIGNFIQYKNIELDLPKMRMLKIKKIMKHEVNWIYKLKNLFK